MIALSCGIKNITGRFFELVTKHACDGRTDRITTPKTVLSIAQSRGKKMNRWKSRGHVTPIVSETVQDKDIVTMD